MRFIKQHWKVLIPVFVALLCVVSIIISYFVFKKKPEPEKIEPFPKVFTIQGEEIQLQSYFIFEKFYMYIPRNFNRAEEKTIVDLYPTGIRPNLVFTNANHTVRFAITFTSQDIKESELEKHLSFLKKEHQDADVLISNVEVKNGSQIGMFAYDILKNTTHYYHYIWYFPIDGRLVYIEFSCESSNKSEWEELLKTVTETLQIGVSKDLDMK